VYFKLQSWGAGGPRQRFVSIAVPSGLIFGVLQGIYYRSVIRGIVEGVLFGGLVGGIIALLTESRLKGTQPDDPKQRRKVFDVVCRGEDFSDPALASAVLAYVEMLRRSQRHSGFKSNMAVLVGFTVVMAALVVVAATSRHWWTAAWGSLLFVCVVPAAVTFPKRYGQMTARLSAAEHRARVLKGNHEAPC
jgi:hypothetical protein